MLDYIQRLSLRHCETSKFKLTQKREPLGRNLRLSNAQELEEGPRYMRVSLMPDRTRKRPNKANTLARWDNEGGAAKGAPQKDRDDLTSLTKEEEWTQPNSRYPTSSPLRARAALRHPPDPRPGIVGNRPIAKSAALTLLRESLALTNFVTTSAREPCSATTPTRPCRQCPDPPEQPRRAWTTARSPHPPHWSPSTRDRPANQAEQAMSKSADPTAVAHVALKFSIGPLGTIPLGFTMRRLPK